MKERRTTALVLAGGGSLGAVQVGMLRVLLAAGQRFDFVVGASVGAINGAYFATNPTPGGVAALEAIDVRSVASSAATVHTPPPDVRRPSGGGV